MGLDCVGGDEQLGSDLDIGLAGHQQLHDLGFPGRQSKGLLDSLERPPCPRFLVMRKPLSVDEKIEVHHQHGEFEIGQLEDMVLEKDDVQRKRDHQRQEGDGDTLQQALLFPRTGFADVEQRGDAMHHHEHAAGEKVIGDRYFHRNRPIPPACADDEEKAEQHEQDDDDVGHPVTDRPVALACRQ